MPTIFADTAELRAIANRLNQRAEATRGDARRLDLQARSVQWSGRAAAACRAQTAALCAQLRLAATQTDGAADALRRHARNVDNALDVLRQLAQAVESAVDAVVDAGESVAGAVVGGIEAGLDWVGIG